MNAAESPPAVHGQILKSTTIIGGSSAVNVVFSVVRAKIAALLVGTTGMGMLGLFISVTGLAQTLAGMGLTTSAVRSIADAAASGDEQKIGRTVITTRRAVLFFGMLGAALFFLFRYQIAWVTFGSHEHATAMGWLALVPLLGAVAGGQGALIRGMRRIGDLARVNVISALLGTVIGLPVLFLWRRDGIAPYLVVLAGCGIATSWWFARRIRVPRMPLNLRTTLLEGSGMVSLGAVFMASGLATLAAAYAVKIVITRELGLSAAGLFEASSQISNVYVGFILTAMAADFFPHLSAVSKDHALSGDLINAQAEVGLLLAAPGILAVTALGPWLLQWLYSAEFAEAFEILRWQVVGTFIRVFTWPMGFLLLARNERALFFLSEVTVNVIYLVLLVFGVRYLGLQGIGPAFFGMYLFYFVVMTGLAKRMIDYRWSPGNLRLIAGTSSLVGLSLGATYVLSPTVAAGSGLLLAAGAGAFSLRRLHGVIGAERFDRALNRLLNKLRIGGRR